MVKKEKLIFASILFVSLILFHDVKISFAETKDADLLIKESLTRFQQVSDYTCTLEKKVKKDGEVYYDPEIIVKYKRPSHYYFKWGRGEFEGQEVIYADGHHDNKLVAHTGGLFRFINLHLDPDGKKAMERNHHSLRKSGMEKIFDILDKSWSRYKETGSGSIRVTGESRIDKRDVWVVHGDFPENKGFYAAKIILYLDRELMLPIKVSVYDWSDELYEEYTFHDLRINTGLDEADFDPDNSDYKY